MGKRTVLLRIALAVVLVMGIVGAGLAPAGQPLALGPLNPGGIQGEPLPDTGGCGI